tara:strand:- start:971 stop:1657 length:687 start_codon:yes stop_codon:yes gene_type:complete
MTLTMGLLLFLLVGSTQKMDFLSVLLVFIIVTILFFLPGLFFYRFGRNRTESSKLVVWAGILYFMFFPLFFIGFLTASSCSDNPACGFPLIPPFFLSLTGLILLIVYKFKNRKANLEYSKNSEVKKGSKFSTIYKAHGLISMFFAFWSLVSLFPQISYGLIPLYALYSFQFLAGLFFYNFGNSRKSPSKLVNFVFFSSFGFYYINLIGFSHINLLGFPIYNHNLYFVK